MIVGRYLEREREKRYIDSLISFIFILVYSINGSLNIF